MNKNETQNLINALKNGVVTVVFKKINTEEIRIMPCTLNPDVLNEHSVQTMALKKFLRIQITLLHGQLIKKHGDLLD